MPVEVVGSVTIRRTGPAQMNLDPTWLFLSMVPSGVGFVLFMYGKKQDRWPQLVGGLLLMVYPYFTPGVGSLISVGAAISAAVYFLVSAGY